MAGCRNRAPCEEAGTPSMRSPDWFWRALLGLARTTRQARGSPFIGLDQVLHAPRCPFWICTHQEPCPTRRCPTPWICMLLRVCWLLLPVLYWAIVVHFLRAASPLTGDGGGMMPSFYWGEMPSPDFGEYVRHQSYYDFLYSLPYWLTGLAMTLVGLGIAPWLLRRLQAYPAHSFRRAAAMTLALLLLLAIGSDVGTLRGTWSAPLFLLHHRHDRFSMWALCQVFMPASILSGATAIGKRWLSPRPYRGFSTR